MQKFCQNNFIQLSSVANHSLGFSHNPRDDLVDLLLERIYFQRIQGVDEGQLYSSLIQVSVLKIESNPGLKERRMETCVFYNIKIAKGISPFQKPPGCFFHAEIFYTRISLFSHFLVVMMNYISRNRDRNCDQTLPINQITVQIRKYT